MAQLNSNYDVSIDYFAVLGVHYGACEKTVKMMYRKMARRYHPDVSTIHDAQSRFQEIALAYEVLKKHRDAYCRDYERNSAHKKYAQTRRTEQTSARSQNSSSSQSRPQNDPFGYSRRAYRKQKPIDGKDRVITYPLTLRYAIRLLNLGTFYIPGLKVKMKFNRTAFEGKTFRLEGKGYSGLFGGKSGDYLVRFNIKLDTIKYQLDGGDIYGVYSLPKSLLKQGKQMELESPSGRLSFKLPDNYSPDEYIKVPNKGLPADRHYPAGDFYLRLTAS